LNDVDAILAAFGDYTEEGDNYRAECPLSGGHHIVIDKTNGRINDFGGCSVAEIWGWLAQRGTRRDEVWIYRDRDGKPVFQHYTFIGKGGEAVKPYKIYRSNGVPVPYKREQHGELPVLLMDLPELLGADSAWLAEGEPDQAALKRRLTNSVATTTRHGAAVWKREFTAQMSHLHRVTILAHRDQAGYRGALIRYRELEAVIPKVRVLLPAEDVNDADEHFAKGYTLKDFVAVSIPELERLAGAKSVRVSGPPATLPQVHAAFHRWLGDGYDNQLLDIVLSVAAVEQLKGDPAWLLIVGGSGSAKTETLTPLSGAGAYMASSIKSDAALLSGSPYKQVAKDATGGLLREIGDSGILVIKDVTSILDMPRESRSNVLSALREIYDGYWYRNLGADGGRKLEWSGRIVVLGGVTTAWDAAHSVIAKMGDRFVLVRTGEGGVESGQQALANLGSEEDMRSELSDVVGRLLGSLHPELVRPVPRIAQNKLLGVADVVTLLRTAVMYDPQGNPADKHAREEPTRFVKQLMQIVRGGLALGIELEDSLALAFRCGRDSIPPRRYLVLREIVNGKETIREIERSTGLPYPSVRRILTELWMLDILQQDWDTKKDRPFRIHQKFDTSVLEQWF
jgi:hypothetical protein